MDLSALANKNILIYGANGYTGRLTTCHFRDRGLRPILAGRSNTVRQFAGILRLEARIFNAEEAENHLGDIDFVINTAGPFAATQEPLMDACIQSKTHYLDVCGKKKEVERALERHERALEAEIVLIPAAGFGVAPPDIAAHLAVQGLPEAGHAFSLAATFGGVSRGTLYSVLSEVDQAGIQWVNHEWAIAQPAQDRVERSIFGQTVQGVNNPLRADLLTVPHGTGVANYQSYMKLPGFAISMMHGKLKWLRRFLMKRLHRLPEGPSKRQMKKGYTLVYAEAATQDGRKSAVELKGPEAYVFTAECLLLLCHQIGNGQGPLGFATPGQWIGEEIQSIEGVTLQTKNL